MGQDNTSKTQIPEWEVQGTFDFSSDGGVKHTIKTTVYVEADNASSAALEAVGVMGYNPNIKRVMQMWKGDDE